MVKISLEMEGGRGEVVITAVFFPTICSKLSLPLRMDQFPKLKSLDLTDMPESITRSIEISMRSDEYWGIVTWGE